MNLPAPLGEGGAAGPWKVCVVDPLCLVTGTSVRTPHPTVSGAWMSVVEAPWRLQVHVEGASGQPAGRAERPRERAARPPARLPACLPASLSVIDLPASAWLFFFPALIFILARALPPSTPPASRKQVGPFAVAAGSIISFLIRNGAETLGRRE